MSSCHVGVNVTSPLPHGESPLGAFIQVRNVPLQVVGVPAAKGQSPLGSDRDDLVMAPFSTAERKVLGVAHPYSGSTRGPVANRLAEAGRVHKDEPQRIAISLQEVRTVPSAPKLHQGLLGASVTPNR